MAQVGALSKIVINSPCTEDWGKMTGDAKRRLCANCDKHVYNLAEMTQSEAETLVTSGQRVCLRLYRRPDGTVLTRECGRGMRRRWRAQVMLAGMIVACLGFFGVRRASAEPILNHAESGEIEEPPDLPFVMGDIELDPLGAVGTPKPTPALELNDIKDHTSEG